MSLISVLCDAGLPAVLVAALIVDAVALVVIAAVVIGMIASRARKAKKAAPHGTAAPALEPPALKPAPPRESAAPSVAATVTPTAVAVRKETAPSPAKLVYVTYERSFYAKLAQSDDNVKARYAALKNELLAYGGVRARLGRANESFYAGRSALARLTLRGKTLSLYLALDPSALNGAGCEYAGDAKRYARTPVRLRIRSDAAVRRAAKAIAAAASEKGLTKSERAAEDFAPPYESTEALTARGLIRVLATAAEGTQVVKADFGTFGREKFKRVDAVTIRASVTAEQAAAALSDETAATLVERAARLAPTARRGRKEIVNVDTLSHSFAGGETVTLAALRKRGLISARATRLKVLARGTLDKPLVVEAAEFSPDAVKMIALTGGRAVRV